MVDILGTLGTILGFNTTDPSEDVSACGTATDVCKSIGDCGDNNPCEAAWQATYTYYADRQFEQAKYQALLGLAYGALQYTSADRTADRQYDVANRQLCIAEEEYARYKCNYVECEDAYAAEVCAEALPDVEYDVHANRAERDVRKKFSIARNKMTRQRNRYCVSDTLYKICEMEKAEALAVIAARDNAYRYAEFRQDFYAERRRIRRLDMLQHGRNIMTAQSSSYNSGSGLATAALTANGQARSDLFTNIAGVGNSFINAYYTSQPGPTYGSGTTTTSGTPTGTPAGNTNFSGFSPSGGGAFAG